MALRILFYCDHADFKDVTKFSTKTVERVLTASGFTVVAVNRTDKPRPLIDSTLLKDYDEAWFFLAATDDDSKLSDDERAALNVWMDAGHGVLITGDHTEEIPGNGVGKTTYKGLGAPIGRLIPRAGALREWDKPPTNLSAQFATSGGDTPTIGDPERDATPQRLLITRFGGKVHPIFDDRPRVLDRLPDHPHEGKVYAPQSSELKPYDRWPVNSSAPQFIASGIDWDAGVATPCMVAWEDAKTSFGRIVADTSWHHYVDYNLKDIATDDNPHWPKIRQLYINLAKWLAPSKFRQGFLGKVLKSMRSNSNWKLAHRSLERIGASARGSLAARLGGPWMTEIDGDLLALHGINLGSEKLPPDFADHLLGAYLCDQDGPTGAYADAAPQVTAPHAHKACLDRAVDSYKKVLTDRKSLLDRLLGLGGDPPRPD